ncbi:MAG: hypothetical protein ACJA1A_000427 [Saprospiraceae bacterium]|mgnify:CR=1 FL=1|jgi:hypothetical protein
MMFFRAEALSSQSFIRFNQKNRYYSFGIIFYPIILKATIIENIPTMYPP